MAILSDSRLVLSQARGLTGATGDATAADIAAAITALKGGVAAPGDTLNELYTLILARAALDSPAFINNPTAPTQSAGNNSTKLATTAFAHQEIINEFAARVGITIQEYDATLTALAGVTVASDKLIYATGADAFATTDFSVFARTLLDDTTNTAARATLSVYSIAEIDTALASAISGLDVKASVRAATTASDTAIAHTGTYTLDGVALSAGNRVLDKNNATQASRGIFVVAAGAWARATDFDAWTEVPGAIIPVEEGTVNADTGWLSSADAGGTIGSTAITFIQAFGNGLYTAGAGLSLTAGVFAISDPELLAMAGVTSAANKLFYFTGSGTGALADFSSYGRSLVDDADAAAARTTLGLSAIVQGDLWYGSGAGVLSSLAKNASATRYLSNTGSSNNPAWAQIDLTTGVTGVLPAANFATGTPTGSKFLRDDQVWTVPAGGGDVVGPAVAVDNAAVRFDSTTGKLVQNSAFTIADTTGEPSWAGAAWVNSTPTVTAAVGTFTSVSCSMYSKTFGKTVAWYAAVVITTIGSAATRMIVPLPSNDARVGAGALSGVNGTTFKAVNGMAHFDAVGKVSCTLYDGTFPGTSGDTIYIGGTYETN